MRITVHSRQSLPDIALEECGSFEAAYVLAQRNGLAITDALAPGQQLEYIPEDIAKKQVVIALAAQGARPATAISEEEEALVPWGGVGLMGIEIDFIVS